jgi:uroporphyrin-III C-methyltransferase/precorrin-2 dehydrogenase/sirohydrochlorin ferrochelatase
VDRRDLFPVFLKLAGRRVLVVGGGVVAASKIDALRRAGAAITVVAPQVAEAILRAGVRVVSRRFRPADLDGHWFVVSAATPAVNRAVARAAARRRIFVNAVDDPSAASAYLGGVLRRRGVTIAVSTDGHAPALAGLLREGIDDLLPADLGRWVARARSLRRAQRRAGVPMASRRPQLLEALTRLYASRGLTLLPEGGSDPATAREGRAR